MSACWSRASAIIAAHDSPAGMRATGSSGSRSRLIHHGATSGRMMSIISRVHLWQDGHDRARHPLRIAPRARARPSNATWRWRLHRASGRTCVECFLRIVSRRRHGLGGGAAGSETRRKRVVPARIDHAGKNPIGVGIARGFRTTIRRCRSAGRFSVQRRRIGSAAPPGIDRAFRANSIVSERSQVPRIDHQMGGVQSK